MIYDKRRSAQCSLPLFAAGWNLNECGMICDKPDVRRRGELDASPASAKGKPASPASAAAAVGG